MSIILKGIDLPKEGELRLIISKNGMICGAEYPKVRHAYPLNLDAEAIQISKGHGRLIDADEAMKQLQADKREAFTKHDVWLMLSKYGAPTILEAEE